MTSSTFSGNSASGNGGAIDNGDNGGTGAATVGDSTFSGNTASDFGGAIDNGAGSTGALTATASTFSGNTAPLGGGRSSSGENSGAGTVWAAADIFDGSCAEGAGAWNDEGYNVGSDASCFSAPPASTDNDSAGAGLASLLGPLANNGGPTETISAPAGQPGPIHRPERHLGQPGRHLVHPLPDNGPARGGERAGPGLRRRLRPRGPPCGAGPVVFYDRGDRAHRTGRDAPVRSGRLQPWRCLLDG